MLLLSVDMNVQYACKILFIISVVGEILPDNLRDKTFRLYIFIETIALYYRVIKLWRHVHRKPCNLQTDLARPFKRASESEVSDIPGTRV